MSKPNAPAYEKAIVYVPESRDFAMYLDGELVGFARTYVEAETTLDELVYSLLHGDDEPARTDDAEDRYNRGDW